MKSNERPAGRPAPGTARHGGIAEPVKLGLLPETTGLPLVIWLLRSSGRQVVVVQVTPWPSGTPTPERDDDYYNPATTVTVMLEPDLIEVTGRLEPADFARFARWMRQNTDVVEDYWSGRIVTPDEAVSRVRKVS